MVEEQKQNMNLNAVRLCFQAYLPDDSGCFTKALPPCISNPVYDSSELNRKKFLWLVKEWFKTDSERKEINILSKVKIVKCEPDLEFL